MSLVNSVWDETFKEDLVKKGFEKCGIYPVNRERYPLEAFSSALLALYKQERAREITVSTSC